MSDLPSPVQNDDALPHDINFVGQSPHVFAYRMFVKRAGETSFTEFAAGDSEDDVPDHHVTGPHPDATRIVINVAVGGKKNSLFKYIVTFSQGGSVVLGGTFARSGRTGAGGGGGDKISVILV